jgi:hypothetical protein
MPSTTAAKAGFAMPSYSQRFAYCLLIAGGCASTSQGEEVRDARMERVDERAEAQEDTVERRQDARDQAVDQRYDSREARVEASDRPGEDASKQLVDISKERAQYQADARSRLEKLGLRINTAQQKIGVLGAQAPLKLKSELQTATKQYDLIKEDIDRLDRTPPSDWEHTTDKLEQREAGLDERISELEESIDDQ